jgi:hypothetical protein
MWHPVEDIAEAWKCSASIWGKVSVVSFYFICWTTVFLNLLSVFHPLKLESYACPLERLHTTDLVTTYIVLIMRLWLLTIMFFFAMVARSGWTLFSTGVLVLYWIANYLIHFPLFLGQHDDDDLACLNQFWQPIGHVVSGVVVIAHVFKWVDEEKVKPQTFSKSESCKNE